MPEPVKWQDAWWYQQPDGSWMRFNDATQQWEAVATASQATQSPAAQAQPAYAPSGGMSTGAKVAIGVAVGVVALLILAILAAIAIPVFLSQREKGWASQSEAALKNAATTQEIYWTLTERYTTSVEDLYAEGLKVPSEVELEVVRADDDGYCMEARHRMPPNDIWSYDSTTGNPREGPCI